ncbi:MAG: hypothetical protein Q9190_002370 [Brigantiaea leucoxantha]
MSGQRVFYGVASVLVGGGLYYVYQAGGDGGVAELKMQKDMTAAGAKLRMERESREQAQKQGEEMARKAGAQLDKTVEDARSKINEADKKISSGMGQAGQKLDQLSADGSKKLDSVYNQASQAYKDTSKELKDSADNFDKTVTKKTTEAKSGIMSWLGFGGK